MEQEMPKTEETEVKNEVVEGVAEAAVTETAEEVTKPKGWPMVLSKAKVCYGWLCRMDRTTKSFLIVFGIFALILVAFTYWKGVFVAATVNGNSISRLSVIQELEKQSGKNVLDTMITKKLIENEIKKAKVTTSAAEVDAELKKVEAQVTAQGGTLDEALAGQGMTLADLREQITINKAIERILADKIAVSDDEVNQYLSTTKMSPTKGASSEDLKNQVREQLRGQKFNTEANQWVSDLRAKATINYYTSYGQ